MALLGVRLRRPVAWILGAAIFVGLPLAAFAQRGGGFFGFGRGAVYENVPYDGKFVFARIRYNRGGGGRRGGGWSAVTGRPSTGPAWRWRRACSCCSWPRRCVMAS